MLMNLVLKILSGLFEQSVSERRCSAQVVDFVRRWFIVSNKRKKYTFDLCGTRLAINSLTTGCDNADKEMLTLRTLG